MISHMTTFTSVTLFCDVFWQWGGLLGADIIHDIIPTP
jgi:hypothetical protein